MPGICIPALLLLLLLPVLTAVVCCAPVAAVIAVSCCFTAAPAVGSLGPHIPLEAARPCGRPIPTAAACCLPCLLLLLLGRRLLLLGLLWCAVLAAGARLQALNRWRWLAGQVELNRPPLCAIATATGRRGSSYSGTYVCAPCVPVRSSSSSHMLLTLAW